MLSRAAVLRKTGFTEQDETTGLEVPTWATVYAGIPFRLDHGGTSGGPGGSSSTSPGDVEVEISTAQGHFPHNTTNLADGDLIEITSGEWVDSVWRIVKATTADQKTARRVPIESAQRPTEWSA